MLRTKKQTKKEPKPEPNPKHIQHQQYISPDYVLDKITLENKTFYRDMQNCILDENAKLSGVYQKNDSGYKYVLFIKKKQ